MNWLKQVITSLILVALGAVVLAAVQDPISKYFNGDRLNAAIQFGYWAERPEKYGILTKEEEKKIAKYSDVDLKLDEDPEFAKIVISNSGQQTVKNIKMKFSRFYKPDVLTLSRDKQPANFTKSVSNISLGILEPGEEIILYLWEPIGFSEILFPSSIKTYSSTGPFRTNFYFFDSNSDMDDASTFDYFMDQWFEFILIILGIIFLIAFIILALHYEDYIKRLLKNENFYLDEKIRYDDDPKKFVPKSSD